MQGTNNYFSIRGIQFFFDDRNAEEARLAFEHAAVYGVPAVWRTFPLASETIRKGCDVIGLARAVRLRTDRALGRVLPVQDAGSRIAELERAWGAAA